MSSCPQKATTYPVDKRGCQNSNCTPSNQSVLQLQTINCNLLSNYWSQAAASEEERQNRRLKDERISESDSQDMYWIKSLSQFCSGSRNANVKEFNYREATSVSSIFPGACVCGSTAACHAEASDITVLLFLTSRPSIRPRVGQVTMSIYAVVVASIFTPGRWIGLVQWACAVTFLHQWGCQRARAEQWRQWEAVQCFWQVFAVDSLAAAISTCPCAYILIWRVHGVLPGAAGAGAATTAAALTPLVPPGGLEVKSSTTSL